MTLRPKGADKPQTKQAVLDMAVDVLAHLEKKVRDRNLNPAASSLNRESEISDDDLDEQEEGTEPYKVPQSVEYQGLDGHPRQIHYTNHLPIIAGGHTAGPFPPGLRDCVYASPLSPALRASPRTPTLETSPICPALGASSMYPAFIPSTLSPALRASPRRPALGASPRPPVLETSPICPALGASSMYPVFIPSTLSPALGAPPAFGASKRPPASETSPIYPALGASPRPPALVASTLSPALGASPRSANQNDTNPISYEDQKFLEDLSKSREASFDILGWPQKVMEYLSSLIQSDEIPAKNTEKNAEKVD